MRGEELWGPFEEVASTGGTGARATSPTPTRRELSVPPPSAPSPAPPSPIAPYESTKPHSDEDMEELASSLPQRGLLQRGRAVRQLRLRSPSPGVLQEEGGPSAAAVEGEMAVEGGLADTTIVGVVDQIVVAAVASLLEELAASVLAEEAPAPGGADAVEGKAGAAGGAAGEAAGGAAALDGLMAGAAGAAGGADAVEGGVPGAVEEEIGAQAEVSRGGGDERLMQQFLTEQYDPVMAGMTPGVARGFWILDSQMGGHLDLDMSMGLPPSCGGATSTDRAPSRDDAAGESHTQPQRETTTGSPDAARDIMGRERVRLMASTNPRAQAFTRALEDARRRETGRDCVEGGGGREVADVHVEGLQQAVDEAMQAGRRQDEGVGDARCVVQETATGPVVPFSGLHLAQGRQSQPVPVAVHGVPPPVITNLGSEPVVAPPRLPSHFAPQEVRRPLDADELAREAVRDVTRLDRRIFDQRLQHPAWQAIPPVPWGPASPVWSGSTSTGARTAGDVPRVSSGVMEMAPRTRDMPPPPPKPPVGDPSSSPTGRGSRSPHTLGRSRIRDTIADVGDRGRGRGVSVNSLEHALRAATRAVLEQTPRKRGVPPRPRPVPAQGGDALGETSGAERLGMPRGSRREQTVAEASARVVVLRKAGAPDTIEEDDPETDVAVREENEDYEGEEEGEEESERGSDGDYDGDEHEPPPPPAMRAARRRAALTSSSARGRRSSTSGTRGGTRRQSGKGKKRR
ncbi:hypothetical protein CBR_g36515 [Chara braunii]|uniref:Uncharacterized protein n=1 Tax=Chara braunii TaxID=69332 RepID=A0A388LL25_CHABU|nr:hypothetical protein CBR_g36515 [Chara braunii]|eukprot:GBG82987.1 hypothetical protein CBR_g36515 [Chara braunii]